MKFLLDLKNKVSGYKMHTLLLIGALASIAQYLFGFNLGIPDLPPATTLGELGQQLWVFGIGITARSAVKKIGK
jgi:hypothetical protein